ncbi:hypothetical protein [Parvularcula maris]|uniref:Lipoprotein n=1 Tax=Parvularcula maris TaxID=2965077 RepID=A0A9X2L659_9PROT|nr:hypothetical protein [Parvularcula maris]MCQ8183799.1 hypothetical protein [Parvularcula maris]
MIRLFSILATAMLAASCQSENKPVSAVNFSLEEVDPACAIGTISAMDGYELTSEDRGSKRSRATFAVGGEELLLNIRRSRGGGSEVYLSMLPSETENPLRRRAARLAVYGADEAVYVNCTEDGRTYGGSGVSIEGQKE